MAVLLANIIDGNAAASDDLPNAQTVACPQCDGSIYRLACSDTDGIGLKTGGGSRERPCAEAMCRGMKLGPINLEWRGIRRR